VFKISIHVTPSPEERIKNLRKDITEILDDSRAINCLYASGYQTVASVAIVKPNDLLKIKNFGSLSLLKTIQALASQGFRIGDSSITDDELNKAFPNRVSGERPNDEPRVLNGNLIKAIFELDDVHRKVKAYDPNKRYEALKPMLLQISQLAKQLRDDGVVLQHVSHPKKLNKRRSKCQSQS
jgi:hypothetical protein